MTTITNVILVTMDDDQHLYSKGYLRFKEDKITELGSMDSYIPQDAEEIVDGNGGILMPGMINVHTHMGMIPFRGLQDDAPDRLRQFLLPAERSEMSAELVYASSKYAMAELLLSGVTTVMDMYYFEKEVAKAADEMKIRAILGETLIDQEVCDADTTRQSLDYSEEMIKEYLGHKLITPCVAPHSTVTCSLETLMAARDLSEKYSIPLSIHVSEMDYEMSYFKDNYNMTPVGYLDSLNMVNSRLVAAHGIYANEVDIQLLSLKKASVAHCIGANTKSAKGVAPIKSMLEKGVSVGLGTDGPSSGNTLDIITQFKLFANFHKMDNHDRSIFPAKKIVELGTSGGAKALGLENLVGTLEVGKQADLVLLETDSINMFPIYDPYACLVYSVNSKNVDTVYVAGECLVKNGELKIADVRKLRDQVYKVMTSKKESLFNEILEK